jgi:hypothetical protein
MIQDQIIELLNDFQSLSLQEIERVKLMTRADEKYLCTLSQLPELLRKAKPEFRALENRGTRLPGYETLYLDTTDHRMYLDHHNGKLNRYKIRIREYLTSKEVFLEIKLKDNQLNTKKIRTPISSDRNFLKPELMSFISTNSPYDPESLQPRLISSFSRITLVNNDIYERVTIDIRPAWQAGVRKIELPNVVIIEVKSVKTTSSSGFGHLLMAERIFPTRLSKYCTGTALLYPEIKHNRFKEKLLILKKLNKNLVYDDSSAALV